MKSQLRNALRDIRDCANDPYLVEGVAIMNSDAIRFAERIHSIANAALKLPPDRNSPEALQQRLARAEEMLTSALNLIGAMQPVCTAADEFFNIGGGAAIPKKAADTLSKLGITVAKYRDYLSRRSQEAKADIAQNKRNIGLQPVRQAGL